MLLLSNTCPADLFICVTNDWINKLARIWKYVQHFLWSDFYFHDGLKKNLQKK